MSENLNALEKAQVLIEALPYIQRFNRKIIVVKYGGSAMVDEKLKKQVIQDVTLLKLVGFKPIIVHGGGKEISKWVAKAGMEPEFINGLRKTDAPTMEIAEMVLNRVNKSLVSMVQELGVQAVGISVQQYYEALARGGSRYREQVQAIWDVIISDKTVQVPEYLGGGRYHVNINQIVQTSGQQAENDTPIGETGAMSVTPINESSFTKSFEEHGFVIGVCCVRHNRSYQQGLERFWSRKDRLDYYVPQFANLGEQPVKKKEIMLTGNTTDDETFGYQEAWADYRMKPNRVSGLMRSNATKSCQKSS